MFEVFTARLNAHHSNVIIRIPMSKVVLNIQILHIFEFLARTGCGLHSCESQLWMSVVNCRQLLNRPDEQSKVARLVSHNGLLADHSTADLPTKHFRLAHNGLSIHFTTLFGWNSITEFAFHWLEFYWGSLLLKASPAEGLSWWSLTVSFAEVLS